jgi:hypothetical protein
VEVQLAFVGAPGGSEGGRCRRRGPGEVGEIGQSRDDDTVGQLSEESSNAKAVSGDAVGIGALHSFDEALESQASKVIGSLGRGVILPSVRGHLSAQGPVGEATDDVGERGDRAKQCHSPRVAEAQARGPLAVVDTREHEGLESGRVGKAGPSLTEGSQEAGIGGDPARRSAVQFSALRESKAKAYLKEGRALRVEPR